MDYTVTRSVLVAIILERLSMIIKHCRRYAIMTLDPINILRDRMHAQIVSLIPSQVLILTTISLLITNILRHKWIMHAIIMEQMDGCRIFNGIDQN